MKRKTKTLISEAPRVRIPAELLADVEAAVARLYPAATFSQTQAVALALRGWLSERV